MKTNREILAKRVILISSAGQNLGQFPIKDALDMADDEGLDLVQVSGEQEIPVCKIIDHGKYIYEIKKKEKQNHKTHQPKLKEIRLTPRIEEGDLMHKVNSAKKFLEEGDKVKVVCVFRGREATHRNIILEKMNKAVIPLLEVGKLEKDISFSDGTCFAIIIPA